VPPALAGAAVRAALTAGGPVPARVAALADQAPQALAGVPAKGTTLLALVVGVAVLAAGSFAYQALGHRLADAAPEQEPRKPARGEKPRKPTPDAEATERAWVNPPLAFTSRVIDAASKAVPSAQVAVVPWRPVSYGGADVSDRLDEVLTRQTTNGEGRCRLTVARRPTMAQNHMAPYYMEGQMLGAADVLALAAAPGHGLAWQTVSPFSGRPETVIRLPREQVVRGRLIDLQGAPAAGVKVHVIWLGRRPQGNYRGLWLGEDCRGLPQWPGPVTTDARGRFTLRGLGRDMGARLEVRDEPFGHQWLDIKTDARGDTKDVTLALAPARVVEGRVTYADTGKPAAGARVLMQQLAIPVFGSALRKTVRTDAQGRFRLNPHRDAFLVAYPPAGEPYLAGDAEVRWSGDAARKQRVEITLRRGILVRGKVTAADTGKPVAGARVHFWSPSWGDLAESGADGTFRVAAPPVRGYLLVSAPGGDFRRVEISYRQLQQEAPGGQRFYPHALVSLDLKPGERTRDVTVPLHRGVTVRGRLLGPDGKPVARALMLSRLNVSALFPKLGAPAEVTGGRFELRGCDPGATYEVFFVDPRHGWGGKAAIAVAPARRQSPVVRLAPCGSATVRFVDDRGQPVAGYWPGFSLVVTPQSFAVDSRNIGRFLGDARNALQWLLEADEEMVQWNLRTDAQGRLTLPNLIPGAAYTLRWDRLSSGDFTRSRTFRVKSGEVLRLADVTMRRGR
jgi:protocatechuate 3,4-dioxygenase beta subunit